MSAPTVSIIIPVIRPEKAKRCIEEALFHTAGMDAVVVSAEDTDRIGCPKMVDRLVSEARGDLICFLGDDTIPQPGFLEAALAAMATLPDGWGLVALNDGIHNGELATHWLADRRMLDLIPGRQFFSTDYQHCFCDRELTDIAKDHGRYAYAADAVIIHDHPIRTGEEPDDDLKRVYRAEVYEADQRTYWRRKRERNGFKLGIGFPLVDDKVPVQFFTSFTCMEKPAEYTMLLPQFPHGPFVGNIADARNSLVKQALDDGCTHLLMCDTDQIYPADTLTRLLAHDVDVCGVRVHRRWPPFDVILLRGDLGRYEHVPEAECFSGDLVDVDATGTGCLLFKMEVFDRVPAPWFKLHYHQGKPVGEDIYFCSQARKAGVRIAVDTGIEVGHFSTHVIGRGTYLLYKKLNSQAA